MGWTPPRDSPAVAPATPFGYCRGEHRPLGVALSSCIRHRMRRFLLGWKVLGYAARLNAHIVNYADDLTILCRGTAEEAMHAMREMMGRLKLTVNEEKTRLCCVPESSFDFLGYTFGRCYSAKTGRSYIGSRPSKKSIAKVRRTISELTNRRRLLIDTELGVVHLNRVLTGWANYFCLGPVSKAYRAIDAHDTSLCWAVAVSILRGDLFGKAPQGGPLR